MVGLLLVGSGGPTSAEPPAAAPGAAPRDTVPRDTVAGIARRPGGKPLAFVQVRVRDRSGREGVDETLEDGRFQVTGLAEGPVQIRAYLLGCPDNGTDRVLERAARTGAGDLVLELDVGQELAIRVAAGRFSHDAIDEGRVLRIRGRAHSPARLFLVDPSLPERSRVLTYFAAIEDGALHFRRVRPGLAWTLWIPWSRDVQGTLYETGDALVAGERTVTLEPGEPVGVLLEWPPMEGASRSGSGPAPRAVALVRGPVRVEVSMDRWEGQAGLSPPVPTGRWTATAYDRLAAGGRHEASAEVEAGSSVWLDLRPVPAGTK